MKTGKIARALFCAALLVAAGVAGHQPVRGGQADGRHAHAVRTRGDRAMGFSHGSTTHHFRLLPDGGMIEVIVNDAADTSSRNAIRTHLGLIATRFSAGDFSLPMHIHGTIPPGVPQMESLRTKIRYAYEAEDYGARVRISTRNARALVAIHEFLRFQIIDHRTGDPLEVLEQPPR